MKAIVLHGPGSITTQVLHAMVHNAAKALIKGTAGGYGVGRVAASGPDTTALELLRSGHLSRSEDRRGRQDGQSGCGYCRPRPPWTLLWISASPGATDSESLGQAILPLRRYGRVCITGGRGDAALPVPHGFMVFKDLALRASWMYEREHVRALIKMAQPGALKLGKAAGLEVIAFYPLERMEEAPDKGLEAGASELVVIGPQ
ncbi:alcohol dehydrogenase [Metarhizium robertsii ARSEF 23]|nr:alcohol dehydrogenase [Metarhizium robertsii ARSEF 23]EFZ02870.2 alcohol dehydrogenase [Metarhizium robertsii ARSEF 23]